MQAGRGREWSLCCLPVTPVHILDYHRDPPQQQHQVLGKLPLLTFPAASPAALWQSVLHQYQATCSFSEHNTPFHSFVSAVLLHVEYSSLMFISTFSAWQKKIFWQIFIYLDTKPVKTSPLPGKFP